MKRLIILAFVVACGQKPKPAVVPVLPGDGDANVAKPVAPVGKPPVNDPWAGRTDLIVAPAPKPPSKLELPSVEEIKLANGLKVLVVKTTRLPVVSLQLAIRAGRMQEPRARLGVAEATADMLVKGTKKRNAVGLAKAIDFVGGTIGADATYEATLVSCTVLARNLSTCLQLVPEMITQSTFPEDEFGKIKERLIAGVRQRLDDAGLLAGAHAQNLLWGNEHVRGWIDSEASIASLRRDDLLAWHKTWYAPNNAILVITGDVDTKKLKGDLERSFGTWKKATVPPTPSYKEPSLSGTRIRLIDKPGQTQTHIRIAQFGIRHDDARFFESLVWNYALGGGAFSSRLVKVVRVEGGKTYRASSAFDRNLDRGSFVAQSFTRNSEAVATTKLMLGEIAKMAKDGPTQPEVEAAIANISGSYAMRFQSAGDIGAALLGAELHGFGVEYLTNYPLVVGKVDVDAAKKAAAEVLDPRNYVIVLVGDAKDLEPQLTKAGWRFEKIAFTDPIGGGAQQSAAATPADPKTLAGARQILVEALATKGGKTKLSAVKGLRMVATGSTGMKGQKVPVEIERLFVLPDKMRIDASLAKQKYTIVADGKKGWMQQGGQVQEVNDPNAALQGQFEIWREPELILLKAADASAKINPQKDDNIDGKPHAVIRLASPQGPELTLYIDRKTKLLTRLSYTDGSQVQTDDFSDYKDVGGIKVAHKRVNAGGGRTTTLELTKVEWDPNVPPEKFQKPK